MIKKPMKADTVEDLSKIKYPVFGTYKWDGIRTVVNDKKALTLSFKAVPNNYIRNRVEASALEGFDGELIVKKNGKVLPFNEISSAVMSEDGEPDFTYMVFDYCIESKEGYSDRMARLASTPIGKNTEYVLPIKINNELELIAYLNKAISEGFEGVMIRSPDGPYKFGRSTLTEGYLLKIKPFYDSEAIIIGFEEMMHNANLPTKDVFGHTERSSHKANQIPMNTLGKFLVREYKTRVEFKIGTGKGLTAVLRKKIWDNKQDFIGKLIKYKAQACGEKDKPRIPIFLGFRDERDM